MVLWLSPIGEKHVETHEVVHRLIHVRVGEISVESQIQNSVGIECPFGFAADFGVVRPVDFPKVHRPFFVIVQKNKGSSAGSGLVWKVQNLPRGSVSHTIRQKAFGVGGKTLCSSVRWAKREAVKPHETASPAFGNS